MNSRILKILLFLSFYGIIFSSFSQSAPANFEGSASGMIITLTWIPENSNPNSGYVIKAKRNPGGVFPSTPSFAALPLTNDADLTDGAGMIEITDENIDTYNGFTNIVAGAQYDFEIFTYDNNSLSSAASTTVYTIATDPGAFPGSFTFTATPAGNQIDLAFTKASRPPMSSHGYLILRRAGSNPDLSGISDGSAPGGTYRIQTISDSTATSYSDNTAVAGVSYTYSVVPYRVGFNGVNPINETYNYGSLSTFATASIPLVSTINKITGGIAPSPLGSAAVTQAILGFSIISNGTPNFTAINIPVTSTTLDKFANAYLYQSNDGSFGGDSPVASVTSNLTAGQIQLSNFSVPLSSTAKNFFIVVDVLGTVSASTPTITPSFSNANVTISGGGSVTVNASPITGSTYSFIDNSPPIISSRIPAHNSTGISVLLNQYTLTFNEPVVYVGDNSNDANRIRIWDDDANAFIETIPAVDVNVAGNVVTFPTTYLYGPDVNYDVVIGNSVFEDLVGNPFGGVAVNGWGFQSELAPSITSLSTTTRCIGDPLTITGFRFTGTGGTGNTKPVVKINGTIVDANNITLHSSSSITLTVPTGAVTGNVTVVNQDNFLTSNGISLTVRPEINTGLTVTPSTFNPAQNTSVDFSIENTQNSYGYALIANSTPGGYSATTQNTTGDGGTKVLTTSPSLSKIGDYIYRIDVTRSGCLTKTLSNSPIIITVASLTVSASATKTTMCNGESIILIGSVSGGTGFYQFKWTSDPVGFNSTSSSPVVSPTSNIRYNLEVKDNANNIIIDFVDIVVNPKPTVNIIPAPLESSVRTNYTLENKDYQLYSSEANGVFSGQGVTLKNDGFYYFNPQNAGVGSHLITLTYTDVSGCQDTDALTFNVTNSVVDGLEQLYCKSRTTDTGLKLNVNAITSPGYQFTRLRLYYNGIYYDLPQNPAVVGTPPAAGMPIGAIYPLTITAVKDVIDNQTFLTTQIPDTYSLNIQHIINGWGYGGFYLDVFAKDAFGFEQLITWQYFRVVDNQIAPAIVGLPKENICSDEIPVALTSSIVGYAIEQFGINPGYSGALTGAKNENFNPGHSSILNSGYSEELLTIQMDYKDYNNCPASVTTDINWVRKPEGPIANDVEFCQVVDGLASSYSIKGEPFPSDLKSTPLWYDAASPATVLDDINWELTAPGITGLTPLVKTYLVQQQYKGCKGSTTSVDLEIKPAPTSAFTPGPICQAKDFDLAGPIDAGLSQPYDKYEWNFGDLSDTQVILNDQNITYNYINDGNYNIRLTVTNNRGCQNSEIRSITVGLNPKPSFTFKQTCEGDLTEFTGSADIGVEKYEWDFGDGVTISKGNSNDALPPPHVGTYISPKHTFAENSINAAGDYNVIITSYTNIGCSSSFSKVVTILDTLVRTTLNPYIMATEDGGTGLWRLEDANGNSTWEFATPTTPLMQQFVTSAWVTNPMGFYAANEKSFLNSPCFNISDIERPILSMDMIFDTDKNIEGAVLEYSKDNGNSWVPLGIENSGLNWFNTTGFRIGNIGNSPVGWSGRSSVDLDDNPAGDILVQARRALDNLANLTRPERSKVRFRIAFATTADAKNEFEGIGFNNLSIRTRDRISLIEMFTNENSPNYTANNNAFKGISTDEIAKIQYHVTYPDNEPNASANKVDPSARAAYYGIPMTDQYVPRSYVDGYSGGMLIEGNWAVRELNKQSLLNSQYDIKIDSLEAADNSYLKMKVTVEAKVDIPVSRNHVLHIAVVEKVVGSNEFVLRKLVPDVNGHMLPGMNLADAEIVIDSVQLEKQFVNVNNLAIVAFVQDINSREVFQSAFELKPGYLPVLITGIESMLTEQVNVYPNPATVEFRVELPSPVHHDAAMYLIDQVGRRHNSGIIPSGSNSANVNVENFAEGIYILEIGSTNVGIVRKKIMIVMKK